MKTLITFQFIFVVNTTFSQDILKSKLITQKPIYCHILKEDSSGYWYLNKSNKKNEIVRKIEYDVCYGCDPDSIWYNQNFKLISKREYDKGKILFDSTVPPQQYIYKSINELGKYRKSQKIGTILIVSSSILLINSFNLAFDNDNFGKVCGFLTVGSAIGGGIFLIESKRHIKKSRLYLDYAGTSFSLKMKF